jgi:hypothetical protein
MAAHDALKGLVSSINERMRYMMEAQHQNHQNLLQHQAMSHRSLIEKLSRPKQVIRDANGKIIGVQ